MNNPTKRPRSQTILCTLLSLGIALMGFRVDPALAQQRGGELPPPGCIKEAGPGGIIRCPEPGCTLQGTGGTGVGQKLVQICPGQPPRELSPGSENPGGSPISGGGQPTGGPGVTTPPAGPGIGGALLIGGLLAGAAALAAAAGGGLGGGGGGGGGGGAGGGGGNNACAGNTRASCCSSTSPGSSPVACAVRVQCGCPAGTADIGATSCGPGEAFGTCRTCRC